MDAEPNIGRKPSKQFLDFFFFFFWDDSQKIAANKHVEPDSANSVRSSEQKLLLVTCFQAK